MSKNEFLSILRQTLTGEVNSEVIEQNMKYYDQYISGASSEQEKILEELGDPRLIAKTIIETEKAAREKYGYDRSSQSYHGQYKDVNVDRENKWSKSEKTFFSNLTWRNKLTLSIILIILILFIFLIGRIMISFLFTFGLPIILLLLVWSLFRKRH